MNRFIPILLCCLLGCAKASGDFIATVPKPNHKAVETVKTDPLPPNPVPPPPVVYPVVSLPEKMTGKVGIPLFITSVTNCKSVIWFDDDPHDNLWVMPGGMLNDQYKYTTMIIASLPGEYRLKAIAAMADVPIQSDWCIITITGATPPPVPPGPIPPVPPAPVPVVTAINLRIVTIEDATKRTPDIAAMLNDPYWLSLQSKGHKFEKYNTTNKAATDAFAPQIQANGGLPCIIIIDLTTNKWLNKSPDDLKLPIDSTVLKSRLSKFTGNLP